MEHLKNLLAGARQVLVLNPADAYIRPRGGFAQDAEALRGDSRRVAADLNRATKTHGQPVDHRKA
ncbi:hypothetical protein [Accumulibacter sp.]|uniref:hypothetical protein n=1 Tax=Accumulibacter sp. TaxID=2053492 RepID=UPI0025FAAF7A|nr:hypothetical protein [Accumulibacter sp.]MCM8625529.1 hypothetical protein [Accumulibacter sp.]